MRAHLFSRRLRSLAESFFAFGVTWIYAHLVRSFSVVNDSGLAKGIVLY